MIITQLECKSWKGEKKFFQNEYYLNQNYKAKCKYFDEMKRIIILNFNYSINRLKNAF